MKNPRKDPSKDPIKKIIIHTTKEVLVIVQLMFSPTSK